MAQDIIWIRSIAEQAPTAASGLEQGVRHRFAHQPQLFKRIDLFAHEVDMNGGAARDLKGEKPGLIPIGSHLESRLGHDAAFEVRL